MTKTEVPRIGVWRYWERVRLAIENELFVDGRFELAGDVDDNNNGDGGSFGDDDDLLSSVRSVYTNVELSPLGGETVTGEAAAAPIVMDEVYVHAPAGIHSPDKHASMYCRARERCRYVELVHGGDPALADVDYSDCTCRLPVQWEKVVIEMWRRRRRSPQREESAATTLACDNESIVVLVAIVGLDLDGAPQIRAVETTM